MQTKCCGIDWQSISIRDLIWILTANSFIDILNNCAISDIRVYLADIDAVQRAKVGIKKQISYLLLPSRKATISKKLADLMRVRFLSKFKK